MKIIIRIIVGGEEWLVADVTNDFCIVEDEFLDVYAAAGRAVALGQNRDVFVGHGR